MGMNPENHLALGISPPMISGSTLSEREALMRMTSKQEAAYGSGAIHGPSRVSESS
jgi:hypothetical protein